MAASTCSSSPCSFSFEIFLPQSLMFSTDLNQSIICSFTKKLVKLLKRLKPKKLSEVTKPIKRLQQHAQKASERKQCSKISKIRQKSLRKCPFSLTLQLCSEEFLTSANTHSKKNNSFECSEIVGDLPIMKKAYNDVTSITKRF